MKHFIALILFFSAFAHAGVISLPRGGKLRLTAPDWNIQETKGITGVDSLFFGHREFNTLQGIILDGTVKDKGECSQARTQVCDRIVPMGEKLSYQIIAQRFIAKETYQNYVLAFTIDRSQEGKLLPVLKKLKSMMELTK